MNPLAKPFIPKLPCVLPPQKKNTETLQKVYHNKESNQLVLFMATAKNVPKGYDFVC